MADLLNELLVTERNYVHRLRSLKADYADPLRTFARSKATAILPAYSAKTLFGNIDNLLPVNEAFLSDLEKMMLPTGPKTVGGIGDVALRHFRDLGAFDIYKQYYGKREEAQKLFEEEIRKSSRFAGFVDRIQYSGADTTSRVGLRELMMDPVQRIPRYTLLFRAMIKHMGPGDPQRARLVEADEAASKIAKAEIDESTIQGAVMYHLGRHIEGFPPGLISHSRRFIDCIDVEDTLSDAPLTAASANSSMVSAGSLHATLFLFDDKLMIVKRPGNGEKTARALAGLDELERKTKAGTLPVGSKKNSLVKTGLVCKSVVDIADIVATDVGGSDVHMYLENLPEGETDRWAGRPFRSLTVVSPPSPANLNPTKTEADKRRFLENLWEAQAWFRTRGGQSVVLRAEDREVEARGGRVTMARTYFNIYQRTAFLKETNKTKIVLHIDEWGTADPIPFGPGGPPFVVVRVQPMAGELSRYTVTSSDLNDEMEEDIVQTGRVPARIVQTIHQFGLFKFKTNNNSLPSTPTASMRSRAALFSLDAISRNLFNARAGSSRSDIFGGSINGSRRTKSTTSRTSTYTASTSGDGSLAKFSQRSNSTAATTISTMDDESFVSNRSVLRSRKLVRRKSPGPSSGGEMERAPSRLSQSLSRSPSRERSVDYSDGEDDIGSRLPDVPSKEGSEWDLSLRLELARRNSQNQQARAVPVLDLDQPVEETIYEEEPPEPLRPPSLASKDTASYRSVTPRPISPVTARPESPDRQSRSTSQHSERRLMGPRCPSPQPDKVPAAVSGLLPSFELSPGKVPSTTTAPSTPGAKARPTGPVSPLPRSRRMPFLPATNIDVTPKQAAAAAAAAATGPGGIEPLSIKKKPSVRASHASPPHVRKPAGRNSLTRPANWDGSPGKRASPQVRSVRTAVPLGHSESKADGSGSDRLVHLAVRARDDIESSQRAVKRIKLEAAHIPSGCSGGDASDYSRPSSPDKTLRTPQRKPVPITMEAQKRMEEMRQLIGKRIDGTPISRSQSASDVSTPHGADTTCLSSVRQTIESLTTSAEADLARATSTHDMLVDEVKSVTTVMKERLADLERTRLELRNSKRQCELVKSLLADATAEKEIMYEAFNEELDGLYNDLTLPEDEAWSAMTTDLRKTKEARNELDKENSQLKRKLAEMETQKEEWAVLLRSHGLIS